MPRSSRVKPDSTLILGQYIRRKRKSLHLSAMSLAGMTGVSVKIIEALEEGFIQPKYYASAVIKIVLQLGLDPVRVMNFLGKKFAIPPKLAVHVTLDKKAALALRGIQEIVADKNPQVIVCNALNLYLDYLKKIEGKKN